MAVPLDLYLFVILPYCIQPTCVCVCYISSFFLFLHRFALLMTCDELRACTSHNTKKKER